MLSQLPAFIAATMGEALSYELLLLVLFCLVLHIRRSLYRLLRWYRAQQEPDDRLRAALWRVLRGQ